jgi:hypothetical protein
MWIFLSLMNDATVSTFCYVPRSSSELTYMRRASRSVCSLYESERRDARVLTAACQSPSAFLFLTGRLRCQRSCISRATWPDCYEDHPLPLTRRASRFIFNTMLTVATCTDVFSNPKRT